MSVDITTSLAEAAIVETSQRRQEPDWLRNRRIEAFRSFLSAPNPAWDRTDVDRVDFRSILPFHDVALTDDVQALPAPVQEWVTSSDPQGGLLIQVDSTLAYRRVPTELEAQGVIFTSIDRAVQEHPDLVKAHLMTQVVQPDEDKLIALHAALISGGVFLYVPKNTRVALPLQFAVYSEKEGLGLFPHVLVVADEGSEVTLVETYNTGSENHVASQVTEVIAKANAKVTIGSIQSWGDGTDAFNTRRAKLDRDSSVHWVLGELGSRMGRAATRSFLEGDGSESTALMVFFGDQSQHLDAGIVMTHIGHHTSSDMLTKGVLKDESRCVYRALTDIESGARNTTAFQRENTLVLSERARVDAIPGLEIEETEVQAGHAATVGQIDEAELFYMMSRGVPRRESVRLIVNGFFDPVLQRIPLDGARSQLRELIDRKMNR